ncbi:hypothetical protein SAMN05421773_11341 [Streptomyces aidingensis]|uniref:Uncharacterized protein n=1 Tax=Streptomyces aidingensis TaxID=910347 RepID=A0A1I1RDY0_9ACTN|nr:hypothetical protein SAMN05421773_11341 [Streptomyces aidingensis]
MAFRTGAVLCFGFFSWYPMVRELLPAIQLLPPVASVLVFTYLYGPGHGLRPALCPGALRRPPHDLPGGRRTGLGTRPPRTPGGRENMPELPFSDREHVPYGSTAGPTA